MDASLERRSNAKYAASVFYEGYNDFDVYIEDTAEGYPKIFSFMLSRLLPATVSIERVFPLGDRGRVVSAAQHEAAGGGSRSSVYIIDGDLYLLSGEVTEIPSNVIVLPRYCIENFLIDENAFLQIMNEESAGLDLAALKNAFDFDGWVERSGPLLRDLFETFAVSHKLKSGIPTTSRGHSAICQGNSGEVDAAKVAGIVQSISDQLNQSYGAQQVADTYEYIRQSINYETCFLRTYVSGKDFLLPLLMVRMKRITNSKTANLFIKIRMARWCSLDPLGDFGSKLMQVLGINRAM
ncbi:DUF4435 domain-containing protein [Pseudomonas putida]|uniref:DUF4435 domain-containing protein n=1 Tax=Pseudomonas putida TaxID=303 RepID=UPI00382EBD0F